MLNWRWLYYAVFSNASTSSIERVNLRFGPLLGERRDVDVINARYLQTQLVADSTTEDDRNLGTVSLESHSLVRFSYQHDDTLSVEAIGDHSFEIIRKEDKVHVLIPGYGCGTIDSKEALEKVQRQLPESGITATRHHEFNVKSLVISEYGLTSDNSRLLELLSTVGDSIKQLCIHALRATAGYLDEALSKCPGLSHLGLSEATATAITSVMDAVSNGLPLVQCIGMDWESYNGIEFTRLLEALANPHTAIAKRLQRLVLGDSLSYE